MRNGCRADIAPTILARLGVDLAKLSPPLDGEPLTTAARKPIDRPVTESPVGPKSHDP